MRCINRLLTKLGYRRGKKTFKKGYSFDRKQITARNEYLNIVQQNKELPPSQRRRFVYQDESYIHEHYRVYTHDLFDPEDLLDWVSPRHKGKRLCFTACLVGQDPNPNSLATNPGPHILPCSLDIFQGGKTKDYHGMFDHDFMVKYMEKILQSLKNNKIFNSIIVMDNAKYHKKKVSIIKKSVKKDEYLRYIQENKVDVGEISVQTLGKLTKAALWTFISNHIETKVNPLLVEMAAREGSKCTFLQVNMKTIALTITIVDVLYMLQLQSQGHMLVFTPPYHSDLQPIELVWAFVKQKVGLKYSSESKFSELQSKLEDAFLLLTEEVLHGCISKAVAMEDELYMFMQKESQANIDKASTDGKGERPDADAEESTTSDSENEENEQNEENENESESESDVDTQ